MLPFPAAHAVALSQAKPKSSKLRASGAGTDPGRPTKSKGLFSRALQALVESRLRKADLEIAAHRRLTGIGRE